jgi:hypothetical protein
MEGRKTGWTWNRKRSYYVLVTMSRKPYCTGINYLPTGSCQTTSFFKKLFKAFKLLVKHMGKFLEESFGSYISRYA